MTKLNSGKLCLKFEMSENQFWKHTEKKHTEKNYTPVNSLQVFFGAYIELLYFLAQGVSLKPI